MNCVLEKISATENKCNGLHAAQRTNLFLVLVTDSCTYRRGWLALKDLAKAQLTSPKDN